MTWRCNKHSTLQDDEDPCDQCEIESVDAIELVPPVVVSGKKVNPFCVCVAEHHLPNGKCSECGKWRES